MSAGFLTRGRPISTCTLSGLYEAPPQSIKDRVLRIDTVATTLNASVLGPPAQTPDQHTASSTGSSSSLSSVTITSVVNISPATDAAL